LWFFLKLNNKNRWRAPGPAPLKLFLMENEALIPLNDLKIWQHIVEKYLPVLPYKIEFVES
jgi:hypothetical protein